MPDERPSKPTESGRLFDVEADGIEIGRFPLPPLPSQPDDETTRLIVQRPVLWDNSGRNLFWIEQTESEDEVPMVWVPRSEDEARTVFTLFELATRFLYRSSEDDEEDEGGEDEDGSPTASVREPRRFVLLAADPPELRSLVASGSGLEETSGPIGSVGRTESLEAPDADAAREALAERASALLGRGFVEIIPLETQIVASFPPSRVDGDTAYWSRTESWERVRDLMIPLNPALAGYVPPDPTESIAAFEAEWEFQLPPSYKAFLRVFGPGNACDRFFSLHPAGGPWKDSIGAMTERVREGIEFMGYDFVTEQHARLEPISRMIFFCSDFGANQFGWDPDEPTDANAGEYAILEWPHGWDYVERTASTFSEFFLESLLRDARKRLGGVPSPTFHPCQPDSA